MTKEITEKVGTLIGRIDGIEKSIERISVAIEAISDNNARIEIVEGTIISHRQRINDLERLVEVMSYQLKQISEYMKNDTPVDVYMGKWAIRILCALAGLLAGWLFQHMNAVLGALHRIGG